MIERNTFYDKWPKGLLHATAIIEDIILFRNSTDQLSMPTFQAWLPLFRNILIREDINIVHAHQCVSALTHASLMHAQSMGYHTVYTITRFLA